MASVRRAVFRLISIALALAAASLADYPAAAANAPKQGLWVGGEKAIYEFQGNALKRSGTPRPQIAISSRSFFAPYAMAFDPANNLWVSFQGINDNQPGAPILRITRDDVAKLRGGRSVRPLVLRGSDWGVAQGMAFDSKGNLWVSDTLNREIKELAKKQLNKSGSPAPIVEISSATFAPLSLHFDSQGDLWAVAFGDPFAIMKFTPDQEATSGPPNPELEVPLVDGLHPIDMAFDRAGNLWLAGDRDSQDVIEMFAASDLAGSGSQALAPSVTITSTVFGTINGSGSCLGGMDFDRTGNLWVSVGPDNGSCGFDQQQVVSFSAAQLSSGGSLVPSVVIGQNAKKSNLFIPGPLRFGMSIP